MATYFHGGSSSEIQAASTDHNMQTLYLMNPDNYSAFSDTTNNHQPPPNMLLLNSSSIAAYNALSHPSANMTQHHQQTHHHQQQQHLVGIPLAGPQNHLYNVWSSVEASSQSHIPTRVVGFPQVAAAGGGQTTGLSLSLSPQRNSVSGQMSVAESSAVGGGGGGVQESVILGSKYLKATQELLDEVVSVGKAAEGGGGNKEKGKAAVETVVVGDGESGGKRPAAMVAELTMAQRQELQMKKAKLLSMLDEVEQRYRQYHNQMQIIVASFEQAAGLSSAKSYTSLALKTISKQFRCLRDAITSQIKATSKSLGEEDALQGGGKGEGSSSRLRFVDHQLRQQRALQQLGMMQHNAWRPQRGLPERAVSVLRAWLFEHFLHPYPKDSDKHMLAKQTGLTRSQVSNWFINARVRLWKPMVEEMYLEEIKAHEQNASDENSNQNHEPQNNKDQSDPQANSYNTTRMDHHQAKTLQAHRQQDKTNNQVPSMNHDMVQTVSSAQGFALIGSSDMDFMVSPTKKQRSNNDMQNSPSSILSMEMEMKPNGDTTKDLGARYGTDRHPLITAGGPSHGFEAYQFGDIGRFNPELLGHTYHGNGVSLTLGLHHNENLSISGTHQENYLTNQNIQLGRRLELGSGDPSDFCNITTSGQASHPSGGYEGIDIQNRKRFAAAQLLPDFVT
ncbi:hypothetical protein Drorol1_Dr00004157 [Drosera rotundifolia]